MGSVKRGFGVRAVGLGGLAAAGLCAPLLVVPGASASGPCVVNVIRGAGSHGSGSTCCPDGSNSVGIVSFSSGPGAPKVGTPVCAGDRLGGPFARFDVTVGTGTWSFFPSDIGTFTSNGGLQQPAGDFFGTYYPSGMTPGARAAAGPAAAPAMEATGSYGTVGIYVPGRDGASFTLTAHSGRPELLHVISGEGFAQPAGGSSLQVPAGRGAALTSSGASLTTAWPASARRHVPASQRPPALSVLRFQAGAMPRLRLRLDRAARVTITVVRRGRVVQRRRRALGRGLHAIALGRLAKGRYVLVVGAVDAKGRTTLVRRSIVQS